MKRIIFAVLFSTCLVFAHSQNINNNATFFSNNEQKRLDEIDGNLDQTISLNNPELTRRATSVYITLVDSIEVEISSLSEASEAEKKNYIANLYLTLKGIGDKNIRFVPYYEKLFLQIFHIIKARENNNMEKELYRNVFASLQIIPFYKTSIETKAFLLNAAMIYPDEVLKKYNEYADQSWASEVLETAARTSPLSIKKYLSTYQPIRQVLNVSDDSTIHLILKIYDKYNVKTNAYALVDGIYNHDYSIAKADSIGKSELRYFVNLIKLRKKTKCIGEYSIDKELEYLSLKMVRVINELHDESDQKIRFAIANDLFPEELYTLMVYSKDEIFTSTFLGLYERMVTKMGSAKGEVLLQHVGYNKFRTFIKLCAGFNTLDNFLKTMTDFSKKSMLQNFVRNLESQKGDLSAAVEVADAFGSITDSSALAVIENSLLQEYNRVNEKNDKEGKTIYGLLISLFKDKAFKNKNTFAEISNSYELPVINVLSYKSLIENDSTNLQLHFFFDDDDGKASFKTYIETFTAAGWNIARHEKFVEITNKNKHVIILANYPETEETGGHEAIVNYCDTSGLSPDIIVHRGHSYYAMKTIEKITQNTKLVFLGSCGGYNNLTEILDRSPDVQIIATKQIGTMAVNNPLLLLLATDISLGKDVNWKDLWSQLEKSVKNNKTGYDRFTDYIPPYKNLGAIFIQAYRRLIIKM